MDLPHVTLATAVEMADGKLHVTRDTDEGHDLDRGFFTCTGYSDPRPLMIHVIQPLRVKWLQTEQ